MKHLLLLTLLILGFGIAPWAFSAESAPSVVIRISDGRITATDANGKRVADDAAGKDDAALLQAVIDGSGRGRKITLGSGRYVLQRPLLVDRACVVEGEGRETVLVPPKDDFALRIMKTASSPVRAELEQPGDDGHVKRLEAQLYPVTVRDLCIDGGGHGRGVFVEAVFNLTLQRLHILRTEDGAGLHLGGFVMECVFDDVVVHSCGNLTKKEAAVVIASQPAGDGDASNNIRFRALEVIFPRWNAVHIGAGGGAMTPRLLFFQQCFFHGQLPFEKLPPCDLIHVERCEGSRGVVNFTDCRLTNSHEEHSLLRVTEARLNVTGSVLGGGHGRSAIRIEEKGNVVVQSCTFHDAARIGREFAVEATGGRVTFASNTIDSEKDNRLLLTAVRSAIITGNQFTLATEHPTIHLADDGAKGCANVVIANNTFTEPRAKSAIQRDAQSTGHIKIHGNVFTGTYDKQAVIEPNK